MHFLEISVLLKNSSNELDNGNKGGYMYIVYNSFSFTNKAKKKIHAAYSPMASLRLRSPVFLVFAIALNSKHNKYSYRPIFTMVKK